MILINRLGAEHDTDKAYDVGGAIREGMKSISCHAGAMRK
jgi:hypothetical protein